jgi:ketosteroid isomerase-like protein
MTKVGWSPGFWSSVVFLAASIQLMVVIPAATGQENAEVEEQIWALEEAYMSAFENAKHSEIVDLLHQGFLGWPRESEMPSDRSEVAQFLKDNFPEPLKLRFEIDRAGIRVSGDVVITHYLVNITGKHGGEAVRITHTWIREGSAWKILGGMSSTVPDAFR